MYIIRNIKKKKKMKKPLNIIILEKLHLFIETQKSDLIYPAVGYE